MALNTL